jgi:hypothetical protein
MRQIHCTADRASERPLLAPFQNGSRRPLFRRAWMHQDKLGPPLRMPYLVPRIFSAKFTNANREPRNHLLPCPLPVSGCAEEGKRDEKGS